MSHYYSPISDLYCVELERVQEKRQSNVWFVIVLFLAGLFLYQSIHPARHLRDNPPSNFVEVGSSPTSQRLQQQEIVGRSYWDLAVRQVQAQYPFGTTLPSRPPDDFMLGDASSSGARLRYWNRLREQWNQPEIWESGYEWDTNWVFDALSSVQAVIKDNLRIS